MVYFCDLHNGAVLLLCALFKITAYDFQQVQLSSEHGFEAGKETVPLVS
jgi:hypothetical protein